MKHPEELFVVWEGYGRDGRPELYRATIEKVTATFYFLAGRPSAFGCRARVKHGEFARTESDAWVRFVEKQRAEIERLEAASVRPRELMEAAIHSRSTSPEETT